MRRIWAAALVAALTVLSCWSGVAPVNPAAAETNDDALARRIHSELQGFTDWLARGHVRGYIGEVGWPDDRAGDGDEWNALAERWYRDADAAGLWTTAWSTGEWWGDYPLAVYEASQPWTGVDRPSTQAPVVAAHPSTSVVRRGVNVAGGEFAAPVAAPTSTFSNRNTGLYDTAYHYESQASFDYLARTGVRLVRIPFRWERLQPSLGKALDATELQRLKDVVARAGRAGLQVILDLHNYGAYYKDVAGVGVRYAVGTSQVPRSAFADVWGRVSKNFQNNATVVGYGLMNEPVGMPTVSGLTPAQVWERASQEAVTRIRRNVDKKYVLVGGYDWSGVQRWTANHPAPWIDDSAGKTLYEAHHYWDRDSSGGYARSYAAEVADAEARGF